MAQPSMVPMLADRSGMLRMAQGDVMPVQDISHTVHGRVHNNGGAYCPRRGQGLVWCQCRMVVSLSKWVNKCGVGAGNVGQLFKAKNYTESYFLNKLDKGHIPRESFDSMGTTFFGQTRERGHILPKMFFLLKMSHIELNYAFVVF